jgi:hypothetical protein
MEGDKSPMPCSWDRSSGFFFIYLFILFLFCLGN